jgi:pyruvate formate lyase activating enzyme
MLKEALLYEKLENNRVHCFLCSHHCRIAEGKSGICGVRENQAGTLYTHSYGQVIAQHIDPIEKKPLYHFLPGSSSFSIAAMGCNFQCGFCQNWQISQVKEAQALRLRSERIEPEEIVSLAKRAGSRSISYTYTEPTIFFEYAYEIARLARAEGLYNIFVTNGYMTEEMIRMVHPFLDAANIDLKSFRDETYRKLCKGSLAPVLKSIETMKRLGIWMEVTTLLVTGENDSPEELKEIAGFLAGLDVGIPWHLSRFYPQYNMDGLESTPMIVMKRSYEIGRQAGLRYVYLGNVMGEGNNTYCPRCHELLIERIAFSVKRNKIREEKCPKCETAIQGVGL